MYLMAEHTRMARVDMAMAFLVEKKKKAIRRELVTPPPPMPATVQAAMIKVNTKIPQISMGV